jgi:peroxiredoxin
MIEIVRSICDTTRCFNVAVGRLMLMVALSASLAYAQPTRQTTKTPEEEIALFQDWVGKAFPDFALKTINDETWNRKRLLGKYFVINFWFTGCAPCIEEMPALNKLVAAFKEQGVIFLGPTFNEREQVSSFLKRRIFNYTVLPNATGLIQALSIKYYPTHLIVDKNGIIRAVSVGASQDIYSKLEKSINQVLNEQ